MAKRINVTLSETTLQTIDRLVKPGERSRLIDKAVQYYAATRSPDGIREQLRQATIRDRELDREVMADWSAVDNQSWQRFDEKPKQRPGRDAAKSISQRSTRQ